jgi:pantoate--beta-alanine ligase
VTAAGRNDGGPVPLREVSTPAEARAWRSERREAGERIAFVPTMGNLHRGHLSLVRLAREYAERVVVSIFVNPTQFAEDEDYGAYPRTPEDDRELLREAGVDLLFTPSAETVYPFGETAATRLHVPGLSEDLCGRFRPGHFDGVATVVCRLFCMVMPDVAVFGQKDYQQFLIIRRMTRDLSMPIGIVLAPTVREDDGLAFSSRNRYLSEAERRAAPELHGALGEIRESLLTGDRDYAALEERALARLAVAGFEPDYVGVRDARDLRAPSAQTRELVVLAAARLGRARLIDNLLVRV